MNYSWKKYYLKILTKKVCNVKTRNFKSKTLLFQNTLEHKTMTQELFCNN